MTCVNCGYPKLNSPDECPACGNDPMSATISSDEMVDGASAERRRIATALERIAEAAERMAVSNESIASHTGGP